MSTADTFTLSIRLGNEAMQTGADVAEQLHRAAGILGEYYEALTPGLNSSVYDQNGNRVGEWRAEREERQESAAEIATAVLEAHRIRPDWKRDGEQIHGLLMEAVRAARGEV